MRAHRQIHDLGAPAAYHRAVDRVVARLGMSAGELALLPALLGAPLAEWAEEDEPRLALWHACDAVEMALRLAVALGLGDWARAGGAPPALRGEIARRLEQPTLGRWRGMALALAAAPVADTPLDDLWAWLRDDLEPALAGAGPASSLTELRNRLAHGGGVSHGLAGELIAGWQPRLAATFAPLAALGDVRLIAVGGGDAVPLGVADAAACASARAWAAGQAEVAADAVVAVRGDAVLPLWPLVGWAAPAGEARPVPQVYVRRGEVRLVMTPLGAERAAVAESSDGAVAALLAAGLLGEPVVAPPVAFEIAGFEAEWKRDAGQCVGRDAEVAALIAAAGAPTGLAWVWGAAGSGKSLIAARLVRALGEAGAAPVAFRARAGDGRCTREGLLRFVVERAAALAGAPPPRGRPPREQARELLAALAGRHAVVIDGVDDLIASEPAGAALVAELLLPLAQVARVIAIGRPEAALDEAMRAAGADAPLPDGLPPMHAADVRAMLLDKIGPLARRLVALDRDADDGGVARDRDAVVNPFVDAVVARADGLPIYVAHVIGDVLSGRLRALDAGALPPSLDAYHARVLRRGGAGDAQQLITPLVATLALLEEPLEAVGLHALLVRRLLATDDAAGVRAVHDALAQLAGAVRRVDRDGDGVPEWTLFHPTLRDHVRGAPEQAMAIATARLALAAAARAHRDDAAARYLDDHGIVHLLDAGDVDGAAAALAWPRLCARLADARALPRVLADLRRVAARAPRADAGGVAIATLAGFVAGAAHHVARGGATALVQVALADGDDSPVTRAAEAALAGGAAAARAEADPWLLRRLDRPAHARAGARPRTLLGHAAAVRALVPSGDGVVSVAADGTARVWTGDGSLIRVLAPPATSLMATTRAPPAAAPVELVGAMPVLGAHAAVALAAGRVAIAHGDGVVRSWDVDRGEVRAEVRLGTYAWALATGAGQLACACDDGRLRVLDATTLALLATTAPLAAATAGAGAPYLIVVAAVGDAWVVGGASRGLLILDAATLAPRGELRGVDAAPRALAAVPGTGWALSTGRDGTLALWDVAARRLLARAAIDGDAAVAHAADGRGALIGTRGGGAVRVRLPDLGVVDTARVHAGPVAALARLDDGRAVTGGEDRGVRLLDLDVAAAARPSHGGAVTALLAWRDGAALRVVSAGADGTLKLWDGARGHSLRTVTAHAAPIAALAAAGPALFTAAGREVVEHRRDGDAALRTVAALPPAPAPVHALHAAGADALHAACADGGVYAWTRAAGWAAPAIQHAGAALAVAHDGARLVSGGADSLLRTGDAARRGHGWDVHAVAAAAGVVVSAARDGVIAAWTPGAAAPRLYPELHAGAPGALALSADGRLAASATRDDCVVLWRVADGGEVARWTCDAAPTALAFADARTLAVGDAAGEVVVLART